MWVFVFLFRKLSLKQKTKRCGWWFLFIISSYPWGRIQGSILGSLLFLVYINDLSSVLQLNCHIYAYDTTLLHQVKDPVRAVEFINNQPTLLSQWAEQWKTTFNISKAHFMYITNKRKNTTPTYVSARLHYIGG